MSDCYIYTLANGFSLNVTFCFFSNLSQGNLISPRTFVLLFLCVLLLSVASLSLRPYIGPSVVTVTLLSANCSSEHLLPLKSLICMNGGLSRSWPRPGCPPTPPCRSAGLIGCPRQRMSCRLHHQTKEIMLLFCADKRRRQKNVSFGWCAKQCRGPPPLPQPPGSCSQTINFCWGNFLLRIP